MIVQTLAKSLKSTFPLTKLKVVDLFSYATIVAQAGLVNAEKEFTSRNPSVYAVTPPSPTASSASYDDVGLEANIMDIWKSVLGTQDVNPGTSFFDAGGNR
jgi:hypothetical protein